MNTYSQQSRIYKQFGQLSGSLSRDFGVVETILRSRRQFFEEIRQGLGLQQKTRAMLISSAVSLAVYGVVLGSTHSLAQALSSAVKLPFLFLITLAICMPALYIFSILFGSNQRLSQNVALVLAAITVTAVLLLSFAPITFFFMLTTSSYQFFKLLNVLFFTIAGSVGMFFLSRGMRLAAAEDNLEGAKIQHTILYIWIVLYAFVGSQMAWTLRPFVGYPTSEFELIRQIGGNFYADILLSIGEILGFVIVR
jgi:hypothetical protein